MNTRPFLPTLLPDNAGQDEFGSFEPLATQATVALAKLSGMMRNSAVSDFFWLNWLMREAQLSNQIEGTYTTLDEILGENVGIRVPAERKDDVREVMNYRAAMLTGIQQLKAGRKLTWSLVKELHAQLLAGARGEHKTPGAFRLIPVQIGRPAVYFPPDAIHIPALLENLGQFMEREDINPLLQTAVMHAQFEMIHPFSDGNGRLGRLLITLFLAQKEVIDVPCFYMSAYLHEHRDTYYRSLNGISKRGDWQGWIKFFLRSVATKSRTNMDMLAKMSALYDSSKAIFANLTGSSHAIELLDYLFRHPLFTLPDLRKNSAINLRQQALTTLLARLQAAGIVAKAAEKQGSRPAKWEFTALLELIKA